MIKYLTPIIIILLLFFNLVSGADIIQHEFKKNVAPSAKQFNENFAALATAISKMENRITELEEDASIDYKRLPKGIILAWYAKSGKVPSDWAICDGTNGTPDLRNRFLRGVATFADVGIDEKAKKSHSHTANGSFSSTTSTARASKADGWRVNSRSAPHATGIDHTHKFSGDVNSTTNDVSHIPPNVKVLYIMKIK